MADEKTFETDVIPHRRGRTVWVELRIVTADKLSIEIVGHCFGRSMPTGVVGKGLIKFQMEELSPGAIYQPSEKLGACIECFGHAFRRMGRLL